MGAARLPRFSDLRIRAAEPGDRAELEGFLERWHSLRVARLGVLEHPLDHTMLSGLEGDGAALVDAACSLSSGPIVAFSALSTDWERSEQSGLATLLKGCSARFAARRRTPRRSSGRPRAPTRWTC